MGHTDWRYFVDSNFHKVRVYLDLFQITGVARLQQAEDDAEMQKKTDFLKEKPISSKSDHFAKFLHQRGDYIFGNDKEHPRKFLKNMQIL
mmetsp:Transcript_18488/g.28375  ORF Transcript_18488/g.28375 Transcript_18488/m.28375 type:complete len:90 (+) Transcript_18488:259-528(+)